MGDNYFKSLSTADAARYTAKLTLREGTTLPDPYTLKNGWVNDISKLPSLSFRDVNTYLLDTPSVYTKESLKAYKSLDAYNYFVCGHVQDCFYHDISSSSEMCFIKSEVLPSQRQGQSASLYKVWVCLHKDQGWVLTANCTCMAGLGSACSHVAALLFKLEAAVHLKINEPTAVTSELCAWKKCKKSVEPSPLHEINFTRPKRGSLPIPSELQRPSKMHYSCDDPTEGEFAISQSELHELKKLSPNLAILTSIDIEEQQNIDGSDTDSADETDETSIPEPITSLFDPTVINFSDADLQEHCEKKYSTYKKAYKQSSYNNLAVITRKQSESKDWMIHRAGRITASVCHQAFHTNEISPSQSLMDKILQYSKPVENKYTRYGKVNESKARHSYTNIMSANHINLKVMETGFHVRYDKPFLGASPDGIITCDCHNTRVLEIKCPFKYKDGLSGWEDDKDFPLKSDGTVKVNHPYYLQLQLQMFVCGYTEGELLVYTPTKSMVASVLLDSNLMEQVEKKLFAIFSKHILPEIVSRKQDAENDKDRKLYCTCSRPEFGLMISCESSNCVNKWFHYSCVGIKRKPRGKWFCQECKTREKTHKVRNRKQ